VDKSNGQVSFSVTNDNATLGYLGASKAPWRGYIIVSDACKAYGTSHAGKLNQKRTLLEVYAKYPLLGDVPIIIYFLNIRVAKYTLCDVLCM